MDGLLKSNGRVNSHVLTKTVWVHESAKLDFNELEAQTFQVDVKTALVKQHLYSVFYIIDHDILITSVGM